MNITEQADVKISNWKDDLFEVEFKQGEDEAYVVAQVDCDIRRFKDGNGFQSWNDVEVDGIKIKLMHDYATVNNEETGVLPINASGLKHLKQQFINFLEMVNI